MMELADVPRPIARLTHERRPGHGASRKRRVVVGHAVSVVVLSRQESGPAGRTERANGERITKADALGSQSVQMGCLKPRQAGPLALFPLDDAQGIPPLVVGVDENEVRPLSSRGSQRPKLLSRHDQQTGDRETKVAKAHGWPDNAKGRRPQVSTIVRSARWVIYARQFFPVLTARRPRRTGCGRGACICTSRSPAGTAGTSGRPSASC